MKNLAAECSPDALLPAASSARHPPSEARLLLRFAREGATTRLVERSHFGPQRVQKPLYPEGPGICHAVIIHPPGGVVGGDRMTIDAQVDATARVLATTPGAAKWYRANGHVSAQDVRLQVGAGATLEWLPQETIFFDAADTAMTHEVELAGDAAYIGSEILCFGRAAAGETFTAGRISQRTSIRRGGRLLWFEQGTIAAGSSAMHSPLGLHGNTVCATLIAVGDGMTGRFRWARTSIFSKSIRRCASSAAQPTGCGSTSPPGPPCASSQGRNAA